MPKYQVTRTETVTVTARNENHAEEVAIEEMQENPNGDYEITRLTPHANLTEIMEELETGGFAVWLDDYRNNIHDFVRIDTDGRRGSENARFMLMVSLDEFEKYDGNGYTLLTAEAVDVAEWKHLSPRVLAFKIAVEINKFMEEMPIQLEASVEEIAELLTRMGYTASVESQAWRGMPSWVSIGACGFCNMEAEATQHETPEFTLYCDLNENGDAISGTGFHLSRGDDESDLVTNIGNESAFRVVAKIVASMAKEGMTK